MYHIVTESVHPYNSCSKGAKKPTFLEIYILRVQKVLKRTKWQSTERLDNVGVENVDILYEKSPW